MSHEETQRRPNLMVRGAGAHPIQDGEGQCMDPEMVATIMVQIPKEYKGTTQALRVKLSVERTLKLVKTVYWEYWNATYKNSMVSSTMMENVALYRETNQGQNKGKKTWKKFKGTCSWCGIQGHKAIECNKQKAAENKPDRTRILENQKKCY